MIDVVSAEPLASVTVSDAVYVPAAAYVWVCCAPLPPALSPKLMLYEVIAELPAVEPPASNDTVRGGLASCCAVRGAVGPGGGTPKTIGGVPDWCAPMSGSAYWSLKLAMATPAWKPAESEASEKLPGCKVRSGYPGSAGVAVAEGGVAKVPCCSALAAPSPVGVRNVLHTS